MTFAGTFIEPATDLSHSATPHEQLGVPIYSGFQALRHANGLTGENRLFDQLVARINALDIPYEDQCSPKYYFDLVKAIRDRAGEFDRVVEVGVYMGGASSVLAGCIESFDFDLDLVDINAGFLRFSHERICRIFPEAAGRIRLFHGDVASYVRHVLMDQPNERVIVHHDGAHNFNQVVRDLAALSFVRDRLHSLILQDTHLRGTLEGFNFVDCALFAAFGSELQCQPIGARYGEGDPITFPNHYQGNYFLPDVPEGVVLPMACNEFLYPHPTMRFDDMFPHTLGEEQRKAA
jgi:hypothetical protein